MWKENAIILDEHNKILDIGCDALKYANLSSERPFAFPAGKIESGDIIFYFAKEHMQPGLDKKDTFIFIQRMNDEGVKPLRKSGFSLEKDGAIIDTIYEQRQVSVKIENCRLVLTVEKQTLDWDLSGAAICAAAFRNGMTKFFYSTSTEDGVIEKLKKGGTFDSFFNQDQLRQMTLKEAMNPKVYNVMINLGEDTEAILNLSGREVAVSCFKIGEFYHYMILSADEYMKAVSDLSKGYKRLVSAKDEEKGIDQQFNMFRIWGSDEKIMMIKKLLRKGSVTNTTVLLTGESGTGKTFMAKEIHNASKRAGKPFVHVNCAAIPYHLIESELFGYEEGAFTGARKGGKKGYFEMACGGTLFLDEITEIPLELQGKLLEVLQSKTFYNVGGTVKYEANVRLIAATNKNLKELVKEKKFREDLYYRINVFPIEIPPLRERIESLYAIVSDLLPDICNRLEIEPLMLSFESFEKLKRYPWPGNIRELENILEKAAIMCDGKMILPEDIMMAENEDEPEIRRTLKEICEQSEKEAIIHALQLFHGDKLKAAQYLDIGRTSMFEKIRKYNIAVEEAKK